ncbi:MAG: peptide ABC transporter substrate-binding protein [Caulobacteraceae bacterium]
MGLRTFALLALAALTLSACTSGEARQTCPAGKRCLLVGNGQDPTTLDPNKSTGTWEDRIISDLNMGLVQDDAAGNPIPGLATSWETSPDGLTWNFHLRHDAKWSDGVPITAEDFVFSMRRIMDPATASEYAYLISFIKGAQPVMAGQARPETLGVRAVDPYTLEIRLEHPAPFLLELAKHTTMMPLPRHVVARWGAAWVQPGHYVSSGPYQLVDWRLGNYIRVAKNPYFFDAAKVCFDQIDYFPTIDSVAAERRVLSGELDGNTDISSSRMARLRQQAPEFVHTHTYLGTSYLVFNSHIPALRDPRVRRAIAMSIDREFIANRLMVDGKVPAYTFVPPGIANYTPPAPPVWSTWPFEQRLAEARRLMAAAGYSREHPLVLDVFHASNPDTALVMQAMQADWAQAYIKVNLNQRDAALNYQALRARDFQLASGGWIADFNDAINFLDLQRSTTHDMNYGDYNNPVFDALLAKADNEPDLARRAAYLRQAEAIMLADTPITPLYYNVNKNLVSPRITGFVDNIADHHRSRYLCQK